MEQQYNSASPASSSNRMSQVGIERAAVAVVSLFGALLAALLSFYAVFPWTSDGPDLAFGRRLALSALMSGLAIAGIFTVVQFVRGKTWAWFSALVTAAMVLAFGMLCLWCAFFPSNYFERSETAFLLRAGLMFAAPAALTGMLLSLPQVQGRFFRKCER
jgi:amino acid transporter